jgi:5'-nucleotidase
MINRRKFLQTSAAFGALLVASPASLSPSNERPVFATSSLDPTADETLITILHTNDTHSQIDPIPANDKPYAGKGGVARRASLVKRIRQENPNTLLIDAGDAFQGTPYFNFYKGEVEYKAMSAIGYDVGTLGNHEFDNGVESLAAAL